MPSKKEIQLLQYLYKANNRYDNGMKGDIQKNIKTNLALSENDISDMHGSEFLYFNQFPNEPAICITNQGNKFVENYFYKRIKGLFYWIFGLSSIVAAVFAMWAVLQ